MAFGPPRAPDDGSARSGQPLASAIWRAIGPALSPATTTVGTTSTASSTASSSIPTGDPGSKSGRAAATSAANLSPRLSLSLALGSEPDGTAGRAAATDEPVDPSHGPSKWCPAGPRATTDTRPASEGSGQASSGRAGASGSR